MSLVPDSPQFQDYISRINRVVDHISRRLSLPLTVEELATVAAFSPFHFHRIFTALMGETVGDFITRLRLEQAAFNLTYHPGDPITAVALDCGFSSLSGFARAFRRRFGMSALVWRRRRLKQNSKTGHIDSNPGQAPVFHSEYIHDRIESLAREREKKNLPVEVRTLPGWHVVYIRNWGYTPGIWRVWERLQRWAAARDLLAKDSLYIGVTHDDDAVVPVRRCRYDACLVVPAGVQPAGEVGCGNLAGGKYAVLRAAGPYRKLWDLILQGYRDLFGLWLPESGFQPENGPMLELYPGIFEKNRFSVDICLPVKPL